jgi:hypothetical protein
MNSAGENDIEDRELMKGGSLRSKRDLSSAAKNRKRIFRGYLNKLGDCNSGFFSVHLTIEIFP